MRAAGPRSRPLESGPWSRWMSSWESQLRRGNPFVVAAPDLDETDAAFEEAAGGEAFLGEVKGFLVGVDFLWPRLGAAVEAVEFKDVGRFAFEGERLGRGELHFGSEFIAFDASFETLVAGAGAVVAAVEVGDGGIGAGVDDAAAVLGGEKASQFLTLLLPKPRWSGRTTKVGRFSFSEPRP